MLVQVASLVLISSLRGRETGFGTEDMGFEPQIRKAVKEVKDTLRSAVVNSQGVTVGSDG